jgi:hypothetical protein
VLAVYLLFSVACFLTVHEHLSSAFNRCLVTLRTLQPKRFAASEC